MSDINSADRSAYIIIRRHYDKNPRNHGFGGFFYAKYRITENYILFFLYSLIVCPVHTENARVNDPVS